MATAALRTPARKIGQKPRPSLSENAIGSARASKAIDGSARPRLATLIAKKPPRPVWPKYTPSGSASSTAIRVASPDNSRCSPMRVGMPSEPTQCVGEASHAPTDSRKSTPLAAGARPGRDLALDEDQQAVDDHRECHRQQGADDQGRGEELLDALQDQKSETALADDGRDCRQSDDGHNRHAHPGDDDHHGQGQLDP